MYHALVGERNDTLNKVHITVETFKQEMQWLSDNGYQTISLDEIPGAFNRNDPHAKYCIITFDDGYYSLYQHAMPVLQQYNFSATLFLTTIITGEKDFSLLKGIDPDSLPANDRPLTWDEIREMSTKGWEIQSHSLDHADHGNLTEKELQRQVTQSKRIIEEQLKKPVLHYAFPFGKYNRQALKAVKEAGYITTCSVHTGLADINSDIYRLPRLEMNCNDVISSFSRKIMDGFTSKTEKLKASVRNLLFASPVIKDLSKKIIGERMN
ncbi:Polysaccharide deacetylase [Pseudarcicella hirudinis]|uniref:Polysaccharide deacetylase n=2 Tax=Pseudarcicella hirudinis TaxID=1079859 RepID=A0A1I5RG74_9BACT|nr:Polysaccharide deacetylase [Pseudarcicella hirudinis]